MHEHRNKIDKLLRVWITAISVLTVASEAQASSFVDRLHGLEDMNNVDDLTWDDNDIIYDKLDNLFVNALYPAVFSTNEISSEIYNENDALLATEVPSGKIDSISEEELELNYREVEAPHGAEDRVEYDYIQDTDPSIGQEVAQVSDLEIGNAPFVTSANENEQSSMTIDAAANGMGSAENVELKPASDEMYNNANHQQADHTKLSDTTISRVELASHAINHNADTLASNMSRRLEVTGSMVAVSAGEDNTDASGVDVDTGFYISPIIGKATQKEDGSISGYHSKSKGITIGFDTYVRDSMLLGMSYTKADNHMKFSNNKLGDRSKVTSDFYSVYGQVEPYNKNIFISGIGIYGISNIKSSARRGLDSSAISRHKAYSNIVQVTVGTQYKLSERLRFMPQLGIKYSKIRDAAYEEAAAGAAKEGYGLSVSSTKEKVIEGIAGFKMNYDYSLNNKVSISPVVYGFVYKNISAKMPVIKSRVQQTTNNEVLPDSISRARLNFSYGTGLSVKSQNIEMGIFYNGSKTRRYISHSGSMKLKINI